MLKHVKTGLQKKKICSLLFNLKFSYSKIVSKTSFKTPTSDLYVFCGKVSAFVIWVNWKCSKKNKIFNSYIN